MKSGLLVVGVLVWALPLSVRSDAVSPEAAEELRAVVDLMRPAALLRLADDWERLDSDKTGPDAVRAFADRLPDEKARARQALERGDASPMRGLIVRQRRLLARHPLVRDLHVLAVKHTNEGVRHAPEPGDPPGTGDNVYYRPVGPKARDDASPALPPISCYNQLNVEKNIPSSLVDVSGFEAPEVSCRTVYAPATPQTIHSVDLDFDGRRILFVAPDAARTNAWGLFEMEATGTSARPLLPTAFVHEAADCCWLPDGRIAFTSDAAEQGLPCEAGRVKMSNMYRLDPARGCVERLTYDQDSDWYPSVLSDGRLLYVRWEYCDISHFFSRVMMTMNPDGTRQMAYYGSNAFWPNHFGSPLAIPGDDGKFICVVTGHHAPKAGKLCLFDAERASAGVDGAVQFLPGWGRPVEAPVEDRLYQGVYPRFLQPFPLGSSPQDGAGRYFLAAMKPSPHALWGIYLVDVFDNVTLLCECEGWSLNEPIARRSRARPPVVVDRRRENVPTSTIYCGDVYQGEGLKGVPRGTVKEVRVFAYHYAFHHAGSCEASGVESSWDMKYVLGTAPVDKSGGFCFEAPVNRPISIQPLDAEGRAVQLMRSWTVGMPGEYVSCVGCHEKPRVAARPVKMPQLAVSKLALPAGQAKPRTWSFLREIQPILQRRCSGCHDKDADPMVAGRQPDERGVLRFGVKERAAFTRGDKPNLADFRPMCIQYKTPHGVNGVPTADGACASAAGAFAKSYFMLNPWVRRPGPESDNRLMNPLEYHANTSPLVQLLKQGHHGVALSDAEWRTLYTWIDLNAPFWGTWGDQVKWWQNTVERDWARDGASPDAHSRRMRESHRRRQYGEARFQGFWRAEDDPERDSYDYGDAVRDLANVKFEPPSPVAAPTCERDASPAETPADAGARRVVELPGGALGFRRTARMTWFCEVELPLANWRAYRPEHVNGAVDWVGRDHVGPGIPLDDPALPVVRVACDEAVAYARWLSEKTGRKFRLPTEGEWEAAARAGRTETYAWDGGDADFIRRANLADVRLDDLPNQYFVFNYHLHHATADDGVMAVARSDDGRFEANAWGLRNMVGNVEEWCLSPRNEAVARGGAFDTLPRRATYARRNVYFPWQRVYNVGVRLVLDE